MVRSLSGWLIGALGAQLLLGMAVNLFATLPASQPAPSYLAGVGRVIAWALGHGPLMLQLHVTLGLLLFLGALWMLVRAPSWVSILGLTGILAGIFNGASFLVFGQGFSSYLMTVGFVIAAASYTVGAARCTS